MRYFMPKAYSFCAFVVFGFLSLVSCFAWSYDFNFKSEEIPTVVVTGSRILQPLQDVLAPMTVITREDIEKYQINSVQSALSRVPGVAISNSGGLGKVTSVFLRGTESDHALVLIDGIKIGTPSVRGVALQHLSIATIERIEVLRGPASSLYGSEALGGVINIVTRNKNTPSHSSLELATGSDDTTQTTLRHQSNFGTSQFYANVHTLYTDGFNACRGNPNSGCFTVEPDQDGYQTTAVNSGASFYGHDGSEFSMQWYQSRSTTEFDGSFQNEEENLQRVISAYALLPVNHQQYWTVNAGHSWEEADNFANAVFAGRFNSERDSFSVLHHWQRGVQQHGRPASRVSLGFDYQKDQVDSITEYDVDERSNRAIFMQYQGRGDLYQLQASVRRDEDGQFGDFETASLRWGYDLLPVLQLILGAGTAFKTPNFDDLYFPGFSNPNLKPEQSESYEIGLKTTNLTYQWSVQMFKTRISDLIVFDFSTNRPENISQAHVLGFEGAFSGQWKQWDFNAVLSVLDPENRSQGSNFGQSLTRRVERTFGLDLSRRFNRTRFISRIFAQSDRQDDGRRLGGFVTLDLGVEYEATPNLRFSLEGKNITDKDYQTALDYNQPDATVLARVRYSTN